MGLKKVGKAKYQGDQVYQINGLTPTLPVQGGNNSGGSVLDTQKPTDTQKQSTDTTGRNTKTTGMQQQSLLPDSRISTFSLPDFLVRLSALLGKDRGLWTQEEHYFLKLHGFLKTKDPDIFYSKTLQACLAMTIEGLLSESLEYSPTLGIEFNGRYLILKTTEYRRTERECSLSEVLEKNPDQRYFLSQKAMERIGTQLSVQPLTQTMGMALTTIRKEQ